MIIEQYIEQWLSYYTNKNTVLSYRFYLTKFITFCKTNNIIWYEVTSLQIIIFKNELVCKFDNNYAKLIFTVLQKFLSEMYNLNVISNKIITVKSIKYIDKHKNYYVINLEQFTELILLIETYLIIDNIKKDTLILLLELLFYAGLRLNEALSIKINAMFYRRSGCWLEIIGKGGSRGEIPIPFKLHERIRSYCLKYKQPRLYLLLNCFNSQLPLISKTSVYNLLKLAYSSIAKYTILSLRELTPHSFRRSYATYLYEQGLDVRYIQGNLRHRNFYMTMRYIHFTDEKRYNETTLKFGKPHNLTL